MFIVIRSYYRYGNEGDYIDCTFKDFETLDKAKAYEKRWYRPNTQDRDGRDSYRSTHQLR